MRILWAILGELLVCPGAQWIDVIKGDGMYIFPPFSIHSLTVIILYVTEKSITFVLEAKVDPRDNPSRALFAISDFSSLPFTSDRREPTTQNITVESAYGHQGIRIRLLLPKLYYCAIPHQNRASRIAHSPRGNALRGPIQAKMVYDWENKEELCYRLYIEEKKSLEEIMEFMKEHHKFAPRCVPVYPHERYSCPTPTARCVACSCGLYVQWTDFICVATVNGRSKHNSSAGNSPRNKTQRTKTSS